MTVTAHEKKIDPNKEASYDEQVTVRTFRGGKLLDAVDQVPAVRADRNGKMIFYTRPRAGNCETPARSEITDKDGVVWVVKESKKTAVNFTVWLNYVETKERQKPQ